MALLPLCDHGRAPDEAVRYAAHSIMTHVTNSIERANLLTALAYFGMLRHPATAVLDLIGVQNMSESAFYDAVTALGAVQGELRRARADVQKVLEVRFGAEVAAEFATALNTIKDADELSDLLQLAITSRNRNAFRRAVTSRTA